MMKAKSANLAAMAILAMTYPAHAHVTLEGRQAAVGTFYKAVFAVPHGCAGSATTKIRIQIPDGVIAVKPMVKPGWNIEVVNGKYAAPYDFHGSKISEGAKEVVWSGGKLPDDYYDEFVISTYLVPTLKPDTVLYFPTVQECEQGVSRWIDIPAEGQAMHGHDAKTPAPGVKLIAKP
jgi:periplasmic copper chaperone A